MEDEEGDLSDVVLSWSIQEILEGQKKVPKIPCEFDSLDSYFKSFVAPLIEETRSEIGSSLKGIREAPYSEILSVEAQRESQLLYNMDVDAIYTDNTYLARNGDVLILSCFKPEVTEDLLRYGASLVLVMAVSTVVQHQKELRIKVPRNIWPKENGTKFKYALFATNIMTNLRMWDALFSCRNKNDNFTTIKSLLSAKKMGDNSCGICTVEVEGSLSYLAEIQTRLNQSQLDAVMSIISAVRCNHSNHIKLIWGPPGTGKTRTISATLITLNKLKYRTLMCAPTNISVVGVCRRVLQALNDLNGHAHAHDLPFSRGNIILFGNKHKMDINDELQDVLLDYRVDKLSRCFSLSSGWRSCIDSVIKLLENCSYNHNTLPLDIASTGPSDLLAQFGSVTNNLKEFIVDLWIHLPEKCFSPDTITTISDLWDLLKRMNNILSSEDITNSYAKTGFPSFSVAKYDYSKQTGLAEQWLEARFRCLQLLRYLLRSFDLPIGVGKSWTRDYCIRNATLIFCTVSSSYHLRDMDITPINALIIDEAAQVRECESIIPLLLNGLRNAILVGDDRQLQPIVKSHVSKEAGFGVSLFKRLVLLGFEKHFLNMQYRMDPCISLFPNAQFYEGRILDNSNVKSPSYNKEFLELPYGSYAFLNIVDGKEEREGGGNSWRNMVEVAVILHLIKSIFKSWDHAVRKITIGVVSPYSSQVNAIKTRLGTKYDSHDSFNIRVTSIDGFQGEEDDVIILSTVRSNREGALGFLADNQRVNVALTRARHCLWILGNVNTLSISGTIWESLVNDAKQRECLFNATDNAALAKLVLKVKVELDQLGDLLKFDSSVFCNTKWKIIFSSEFRNAFAKLKSAQLRWEVLQKLVGLGCGWRSRVNLGMTYKSEFVKVYKIGDLYLVWSIDLEKGARLFQIIKIWDLVTSQHIERVSQRLRNLFSMYSDDYMEHCRIVQKEGKWELPMVWRAGHEITRLKKDCGADAQDSDDQVDVPYSLDHSKVSESFLLMKFYSLSSGVAKHLLAATDGSEIDIPFELTEQEKEIVLFPCTSFILGRAGTGKTTVLTMKLIQKEQQSLIANQGLYFGEVNLSGDDDNNGLMTLNDVRSEQGFIRQIFLTVSSKLCSVVKNQISRLKRFASDDFSYHPSSLQMHDISDDLEEFSDIPDNFSNIPQKNYPLAITFRKFLMMIDGTLHTSFFDRFYGHLRICNEGGRSKSRALQAYIKSKEVDYEKFSCSYWPHFSVNLTKNLDASTVFTQIISHIKGGNQAGMSPTGKLGRQDYIMLSDIRFPSLSAEMRAKIYDIYLCYEKKKCIADEFDLSDFVISLHCRLSTDGYSGDTLDYIYIDEVQDLTMNQIALLSYVCSNFTEGFVFAGDTAQTISRGIDFRFEDIRRFFYTDFLQKKKHRKAYRISDMFQLSQNFRTHRGILMLAQSIMDLLYHFFPFSVDKLNPETSLVHGDAPVLLASSNGESSLTAIFGGKRSDDSDTNTFGANQVILVRDDTTKEQVVGIVGRKALVLTVLESKGLEFEDVLLYNFFTTSPLRNKWRVIYGCMKVDETISLHKGKAYQEFDGNKHFLLCSELKQLYVAVTRTRQRLWICEDESELCQPMFDYWKRLFLVQVRQLDSSLFKEMKKESSTDDWRLQGIKLFNERQYGMALVCFQKAGDEYRENWARAADLQACGERIVSGNWQRGKGFFMKAAEIYDLIGKHEKAAICFIKSRDFRKAGLVYLEKCGSSRLEDAGECFAMAKCWSQAANAYFEAKCYSKCFSTCFKAELFDLGLKFIRQLEETLSFEGPNCSELNSTRNKYLEDCASHYFHRKDMKVMMQYVKAFSSMDIAHAFLTSRTLFNELLSFHVEMGNFTEAAEVAERIVSVFLGEGTTDSGDITQLALLRVIMNILWTSQGERRYLKGNIHTEPLLKKARDIVRKVSKLYCSASLETDALHDPRKSLANLSNNLFIGSKSILAKFFAARSILDIHLLFGSFGYTFKSWSALENRRWSYDILSCNQMSPISLIFIWNSWKKIVVEVLLRKIPFQTKSGYSSQQGRTRRRLNVDQDGSSVRNYWINELYSVGIRVLSKLELLANISSKETVHPYFKVLIALSVYDISIFFKDTKFGRPKNVDTKDFFVLDERLRNNMDKFKNFFVLSERLFFESVILDCKAETTHNLLYIINSSTAIDLLVPSLNAIGSLLNRGFTSEQLTRLTTLLLLAARLDDRVVSTFIRYLTRNSEWARFFQALKGFLDSGNDRTRMIMMLHTVLESRSIAKWTLKVYYASPMLFDNLMKWFSLLASSYMKSLLVEMLKNYISGSWSRELDHCPIISLIQTLLVKGPMLQEWINKTSATLCLPVLLRLVNALYIRTVTRQLDDPCDISDFLWTHGVLSILPHGFSKIIRNVFLRPCAVGDFTRVFADVLVAMGNKLIVMGLPECCLICYDLTACIISIIELRNAEKQESSPPANCIESFVVECEKNSVPCEAKDQVCRFGEAGLTDCNIVFSKNLEAYLVNMRNRMLIGGSMRCISTSSELLYFLQS